LRAGPYESRRAGEEAQWTLGCLAAGHALPLVIDPGVAGSRWRSAGSELSLSRTETGTVLLTERELALSVLLERDPLEDVRHPLAGVD
jgi:hypothetical protein